MGNDPKIDAALSIARQIERDAPIKAEQDWQARAKTAEGRIEEIKRLNRERVARSRKNKK